MTSILGMSIVQTVVHGRLVALTAAGYEEPQSKYNNT